MSTASDPPAPKPVAAPSTPGRAEEEQIMAVAGTLVLAYGLHPADITRIPEGTATDNYAIADQAGQRHFAKVYRTRAREHLELEQTSVELSEYAADGGVATARATRTREHELIAASGDELAYQLF